MTRRSSAAGLLILLAFAVVSCNGHPARKVGTAVSTVRMISPTGQAELLLRPSTSPRGLVVFMHGIGGDQNQLIDNSGLFSVRDALVQAGYAIVASDAHGNNAGNAASVQDQLDAVRDARARLGDTGDVEILAFSMGGFDALLSAASHDIPKLHGVALLSPAVDQTSFLAGPFADEITAAFGHPAPGEVAALIRHSDPLAQPAADYLGYSYHFWHSPDDRTVPFSQSTTMSGYLATSGIAAPVTRLTGDHGNLSALDPAAVVHFFRDDAT